MFTIGSVMFKLYIASKRGRLDTFFGFTGYTKGRDTFTVDDAEMLLDLTRDCESIIQFAKF